MGGDEQAFIRAILASPDDRTTRLVYADWLDDRSDPRAEYLRLEAKLADAGGSPAIKHRMRELQTSLPPWWLAVMGGLRATKSDPDPARVKLVAGLLGHPVRYTDGEGYECEIVAVATSGFTTAIAYLESRQQWRGQLLDIKYHLRIRDGDREVAWEPESYNPFFGCDVRFLEWYGNEVLIIYREKHDTYICRFGLYCPAVCHAIKDYWILNGRQLGYQGYRETGVRRLAIPSLEELPALSEREAAESELLPSEPG